MTDTIKRETKWRASRREAEHPRSRFWCPSTSSDRVIVPWERPALLCERPSVPSERGAVLIWMILGLAAAVVAGSVWWFQREPAAVDSGFMLYEVGREDLRISVVESGQLKAADSIDIFSEIRGQATVLKLIEEGTYVNQGEILVELDKSAIEDDLTQQKIRYEQAYASWVQAEEAKAIQESLNASNVSKAELDLALAQTDLKKYIEGDWPLEQDGREADIILYESELKTSEQTLADTRELVELQFEPTTTLERDQLERDRAEVRLRKERLAKDIAERFEHQRQLQILRSDVEQAEAELERVKRRAKADLAQKEADLRSKLATRDLEKDKLDQLEEQLGKAIVYAPAAGLVVYPGNSGGGYRGNDRNRVEEGAAVRERQLLVSLPDTSSMMVDVDIHESVVDMVEVDQPALVTVDAFADQSFLGRVVYVAPLPDSANQWLNPDLKVYRCEIRLDTATGVVLRPGMSASAEIIIDEIPDALAIPVHAVHREGSNLYCYRSTAGGPEVVPVEIGLHNDTWVAIVSGLEEGDQIYLAAPPDAPKPEFSPEEAPEDAPRSIEELREQTKGIASATREEPEEAKKPGSPMMAGSAADLEKWKSMSPDQRRKAMQDMMKNMTPEQRAQIEKARQNHGGERPRGGPQSP